MDEKGLKKLRKQTLDQTQKRRDEIKRFYSLSGHRFSKWGRFLDEKATMNIWHIVCAECYQSMVYDGNTDTLTLKLRGRCPGPPSPSQSPRRIELEKKIALDN